jgi:hypothetical protein
MRLSR